MTMNILAAWYNDKSVCSGLEWIKIYFIKDNVLIYTLNNCMCVCVWYVSPSVNIQLPNIPNWNVWMKTENERSARYEWRYKWIYFWNKKKNCFYDKFWRRKWFALCRLLLLFLLRVTYSIRCAEKKWREGG